MTRWVAVGSLAALGAGAAVVGQPGAPAAPEEETVSPGGDGAGPAEVVFGLWGVELEAGPAGEPEPPCSVEEPAFADRSAIEIRAWPNGIVPYDFDANVSALNRQRAEAAIAVIEAVCNVDFIARTGQGTYVRFRDTTTGNGCAGTSGDPCNTNSSPVGFGNGQRTVRVVSWSTQSVIVHELMHTLGFWHEQSRPDRDQYIEIVHENIPDNVSHNFDVRSSAFRPGPYDFGSVMHYGRCAFSVCGPCSEACATIRMRPGYEAYATSIGQRVGLSALDAHGLRSLYPRSGWAFVNAGAASSGSGTGTNPWRSAASALGAAPVGGTVFVMPGAYSAVGTWSRPMTLTAPVGGVTLGD